MKITEAERQYYLSRMGVQLWYARAPLPGAAPTPPLDFTEPETFPDAIAAGVSPAVSSTKTGDNARPVKRSVKELLKSIGGEGDKTSSAATGYSDSTGAEETSAESSQNEGQIARQRAESTVTEKSEPPVDMPTLENVVFDLGVWSGTERYCIVSALSSEVSVELQAKLASNILSALGETVSQHKRLVWPVFNNPLVMKNAGRDLTGLLNDLSQNVVGDRLLIVLGGIAGTPEADGVLLPQLSSRQLVGEDALAALASDADRKRVLWRLLQEQVSGGR